MDRILDSAAAAPPLFSRRAIVLAFALAVALTIGFALWTVFDRSELLDEIDPNLKAIAIGAGAFVGIIADAVAFSALTQGIMVRRAANGLQILATMVVLPVFCVLGSTFVARRAVEYRAFHGLPVVTAPMPFTITGKTSGKSGPSLSLIAGVGERTVTLRVDLATYRAAQVGAHVALPVQTGRGGVRRMIPPPSGITASDLYD